MENTLSEKISQLMQMGLDEKKIHALIFLAFEDFLDELGDELLGASDTDLEQLINEVSQMQNVTPNPKEATSMLRELLKKAFGITVFGRWDEFLLNYFDSCVQEATYAKDLIQKVQNNNPEALKLVSDAQQDEDSDLIAQAIEEVQKL